MWANWCRAAEECVFHMQCDILSPSGCELYGKSIKARCARLIVSFLVRHVSGSLDRDYFQGLTNPILNDNYD